MIDLKKLINEKVENILQEKFLEKIIEENLEKVVKEAVTNALDDYRFKNKIQKKLTEEIDPVIDKISFAGYGEITRQRILSIISQIQSDEFARQVDSAMNVFKKVESIKLSELLLLIVSDIAYDEDLKQWCFSSKYVEGTYYDTLVLKFEVDHGKNEVEFIAHKKDPVYLTVSSFDLDGFKYSFKDKVFSVDRFLNGYEKAFFKTYANYTQIEVDVELAELDGWFSGAVYEACGQCD